ncbi:MAG: hypothetical protein AAFX41_13475 [Bacteroidota bacterium]
MRRVAHRLPPSLRWGLAGTYAVMLARQRLTLGSMVDLLQFASLFEIGFALHIAVAFLERIYARELPVRVERISARLNALERFKREVFEGGVKRDATGQRHALQLAYRQVDNPVWPDRNDALLDQLYELGHIATNRLGTLRRVLAVVTVLSMGVVFYTVTMLFLIGLDLPVVKQLDPLVASALVLAQLLPLPLAAGVFYLVARRMSRQVDRKLRGVGELRVLLNGADSASVLAYVSIEEIYERDLGRLGRWHPER